VVSGLRVVPSTLGPRLLGWVKLLYVIRAVRHLRIMSVLCAASFAKAIILERVCNEPRTVDNVRLL
jgi:hypothetical protein